MQIRKLSILLALASTFALGTATAQESDDPTTDGAATERQRPNPEQTRQRRENVTDEQRAAARERREGMSDEQRQAARDKRQSSDGADRKRGNGKRGNGNGQRGSGNAKGDRAPKSNTDTA